MNQTSQQCQETDLIRRWMLALLASNNGSPIKGKTRLIKQMFLIAKEIAKNRDLDTKLQFFPHLIGPYSTILAKQFNNMLEENLIIFKSQGPTWIFSVSSQYREEAQRFLDTMSETERTQLERMKDITEKWTTKELLSYIYNKYPEYAIYSAVKEEVLACNPVKN